MRGEKDVQDGKATEGVSPPSPAADTAYSVTPAEARTNGVPAGKEKLDSTSAATTEISRFRP
jgi:hypothetical protein